MICHASACHRVLKYTLRMNRSSQPRDLTSKHQSERWDEVLAGHPRPAGIWAYCLLSSHLISYTSYSTFLDNRKLPALNFEALLRYPALLNAYPMFSTWLLFDHHTYKWSHIKIFRLSSDEISVIFCMKRKWRIAKTLKSYCVMSTAQSPQLWDNSASSDLEQPCISL